MKARSRRAMAVAMASGATLALVSLAQGGTAGAATTTIVSAGSAWRDLDNGSNQGTAWRASSFVDSSWAQGNAQLGYGDGDEATVVSFGGNPSAKFRTTYFRRAFTVTNPANLSDVTLNLKRDDGAVVYLNGVEIVRSNMPTGTITSTSYASTAISGAAENAFTAFTIPASAFVAGTNVLAVEIHQDSNADADVSFDLSLSAEDSGGPTGPTGT